VTAVRGIEAMDRVFHPKPSIRGAPNPPAFGPGSQAARNPSSPLRNGLVRAFARHFCRLSIGGTRWDVGLAASKPPE
jgi:hypothetical protein